LAYWASRTALVFSFIVSLGLFGAFGFSGFEGVATPLHIVVVPNVQNVRKERRLGTTERVFGSGRLLTVNC